MIRGIGTDMVDIRRIDRLLQRFGDRFIRKIFTDLEIGYCRAQHNPASAFAKRFAAKEACFKAFGTGLAQGMQWKDIEVRRDGNGKPFIHLSDYFVKKSQERNFGCLDVHLSLTDEFPYAFGFVTISTHP